MVGLLPTAPVPAQFYLKVVINSCHVSNLFILKKKLQMFACYRLANIGEIRSVKLLHASSFFSYLNTRFKKLALFKHDFYAFILPGVKQSLCLADSLFLLGQSLIKNVVMQAAAHRPILPVSVATLHHWKVLLIFAAAGANRHARRSSRCHMAKACWISIRGSETY